MTETPATSAQTCPHCGALLETDAKFCEACGKAVGAETPAAPAAAGEPSPLDDVSPISAVTARPGTTAPEVAAGSRAPCLQCGGAVDDDGYCTQCGTKAPDPRDHFEEQPAPWVGGVCDRGLRHHRNEDAMAMAVDGPRVVLVVCDGVSNTVDSHIGSMNAAHAVLDVLRPPLPRGLGVPESRDAAITRLFTDAAAAGQKAIAATVSEDVPNPPSCTLVAAVLEDGVVHFCGLGDSRIYLLPDAGDGQMLTVDDSMAQLLIAGGMPRAEAEASKQAHSITRWLGKDSAEIVPRVGQVPVTGPGWLLTCSDGLWNYASEPAALKEQIAAAGSGDPLVVARHLVAFANAAGGQDNITAALARVGDVTVVSRQTLACLPRPPPTTTYATMLLPKEGRPMAEFTATVFQNEFLPDGATDVHAIVTVDCSGAGTAGQTGSGAAGEIVIIDTSGSMGQSAMAAAKQAAQAALAEIVDGTYFAVISGNGAAFLAYPLVNAGPAMVPMSEATRAEAADAISRLRSGGGTEISTWLDMAGVLFTSVPQVVQRHAILLTDGENNEPAPVLDEAIARATGFYQCDCRGVGVDWKVEEIRRIAQALLGTVDIIARPETMAADFQAMMQTSMARGVANAELRVWTPQGAQILFVRQVSPTVEDLTHRRTAVNDLTGGYPTGAWSDESRDYHVAVRLAAKAVGQEQLAARVQLAVGEEVKAQGLVKAKWSDDSELTTRIDQQVAHYTGQTELAQAIQEGLAAKAAGNEELATTKLGRAVQLAKETGNEEATSKLRKVVDVEDEDAGTVRLKKTVEKADEMALDTASTKTTRVRQ